MDTLEAVILGLVQGLTEFLPISSSGHLAIVPWLFKWDTPGLAFDAALHFGTLLAVVIYFRAELIRMIRAVPLALRNLVPLLRGEAVDDPLAPDARLGLLIVIGSIPGGILGLAANDAIDRFFHSESHQDRAMIVIAILLAAFGLLLWVAERVSRRDRPLSDLRLADTVIIGIAQAIALFPGTSRSGVTMTAGMFRDLRRADAARFSFLLGLPLILAASLSGIKDLADSGASGVGATQIITGIVVSAVSGLAAIWGLLRFLQHAPTTVFTIYRVLAAIGIMLLIATGVR
ncbi:MAG TPA: undecaprenyl-diphosphate phosphatase [Thermomicrobiales bacterium]|nr:undecaprenyl-diphosphate phosphatase [Thermomicrobiales bacterium]